MKTIEKSIEVAQPVTVIYNHWTQFEDFPEFMVGVKQVRQLDDRTLYWKAEVGGRIEEWTAEIIEQTVDECIAWRSITGAMNSGIVTFQPVDGAHTRMTVRMKYDPKGVVESLGDSLGFMNHRVAGDLGRFKRFIEGRHAPTGCWRGEIHGGKVTPPGLDRGDSLIE